jgi:membrane-associated phospholipid phosphatase
VKARGAVGGALLLAALATASKAAQAADPQTVEWSPTWKKVEPWEVGGTFAFLGAAIGIEVIASAPAQPHFRGGILFDNWVRKELRGQTQASQSRAQQWSTKFFKGSVLVPFVVDDYFGALSLHENSELAVQMAAIDLEAFSVAGVASLGAEKFAGRARPFVADCGKDGTVRDAAGHVLHVCDSSANESFFSGHSAAAATAAGLVCVDHQHLPLFGGGLPDLAPCILMIGAAGATGVLRIVADDHWASDVLLGWSVGAVSGYVLPSLLHYGFGSGRPIDQVHAGSLVMTPTLVPYQGGAGLGAVGVF